MTAHAEALTLIWHALPISFLVNDEIIGTPYCIHMLFRNCIISSSQSDATNTHCAIFFSTARCVSFIPTTAEDCFKSSRVKSITYLSCIFYTTREVYHYIIFLATFNGKFISYSSAHLLQRIRVFLFVLALYFYNSSFVFIFYSDML